MKTSYPKPAEPAWLIIDASEYTLGRLAARLVTILRGKHKPGFVPHQICGDHVIVINAKKVKLTGAKGEQKTYFRHTGYFGHDTQTPIAHMLEKKPEDVIKLAVKGMLPKNSHRAEILSKRLHVYAGAEHDHTAQQPTTLTLS